MKLLLAIVYARGGSIFNALRIVTSNETLAGMMSYSKIKQRITELFLKPGKGEKRFKCIRKICSKRWFDRITLLATIVLAYTSMEGLGVARKGLKDAKEVFETDSRAWVAPVAVGFDGQLTNGYPITVAITFENVGKTPATDVHYRFTKKVVPNSAREEEEIAITDVEESYVCKDILPAKQAPVVYPGGKGTVYTETLNPNTDEYKQFMAGGQTLIIRMCVVYNSLGKVRHSAFCNYYTPNVSPENNFNKCTKGNYAD